LRTIQNFWLSAKSKNLKISENNLTIFSNRIKFLAVEKSRIGQLKQALEGESIIFEAGAIFFNSLNSSKIYEDLFDTLVFGIRVASTVTLENGETATSAPAPPEHLVGNLVESNFLIEYYDLVH
jgi:hypothetical protein